MNKKAAIELSMNTIVVIVIGVVLLSLGLVFVRGIFSGITDISEGAFAEAQDALSLLGEVDSLLTVSPTNIELKQGNDKGIGVVVYNLYETPITYRLVATPSDSNIECVFSVRGGFSEETEEATLDSGKKKEYSFFMEEKDGGVRKASCFIEIVGAPDSEDASVIASIVG